MQKRASVGVLFRLGQVVWWLGTSAVLLVAVAVAAWMAMDLASGIQLGRFIWPSAVGSLAICWTLSYVLTGSFWRPPRNPQ